MVRKLPNESSLFSAPLSFAPHVAKAARASVSTIPDAKPISAAALWLRAAACAHHDEGPWPVVESKRAGVACAVTANGTKVVLPPWLLWSKDAQQWAAMQPAGACYQPCLHAPDAICSPGLRIKRPSQATQIQPGASAATQPGVTTAADSLDQGLLCHTPPLPAGTLHHLTTQDIISLGSTCSALRWLLRSLRERESQALAPILSASTSSTHGTASRATSSQTEATATGVHQAMTPRTAGLARWYSLVYGSPEAAAAAHSKLGSAVDGHAGLEWANVRAWDPDDRWMDPLTELVDGICDALDTEECPDDSDEVGAESASLQPSHPAVFKDIAILSLGDLPQRSAHARSQASSSSSSSSTEGTSWHFCRFNKVVIIGPQLLEDQLLPWVESGVDDLAAQAKGFRDRLVAAGQDSLLTAHGCELQCMPDAVPVAATAGLSAARQTAGATAAGAADEAGDAGTDGDASTSSEVSGSSEEGSSESSGSGSDDGPLVNFEDFEWRSIAEACLHDEGMVQASLHLARVAAAAVQQRQALVLVSTSWGAA